MILSNKFYCIKYGQDFFRKDVKIDLEINDLKEHFYCKNKECDQAELFLEYELDDYNLDRIKEILEAIKQDKISYFNNIARLKKYSNKYNDDWGNYGLNNDEIEEIKIENEDLSFMINI